MADRVVYVKEGRPAGEESPSRRRDGMGCASSHGGRGSFPHSPLPTLAQPLREGWWRWRAHCPPTSPRPVCPV